MVTPQEKTHYQAFKRKAATTTPKVREATATTQQPKRTEATFTTGTDHQMRVFISVTEGNNIRFLFETRGRHTAPRPKREMPQDLGGRAPKEERPPPRPRRDGAATTATHRAKKSTPPTDLRRGSPHRPNKRERREATSPRREKTSPEEMTR